MPGLASLPPETLCHIFSMLIPEVIKTGAFHVDDEHRRRQTALCSLTQIPKLRNIAIEHLYRNLVITSTTQMVCLFRTLNENLSLREFPRYLANLVPLMDSTIQEHIENDMRRHLPLIPAALTGTRPTHISALKLEQDADPESPRSPLWTHRIMERLLIMLPLLRDILVSIRPIEAAFSLNRFARHPDRAFFTENLYPPIPSSGRVTRTLRIQNHPYSTPLDGPWFHQALLPLFQLYFPPFLSDGCLVSDLRFLNLGDVTEYEIKGVDRVGLCSAFGAHWPHGNNSERLHRWLSRLQKLTLTWSRLSPEEVGHLLFCCKSLKTLVWRPAWNLPVFIQDRVQRALDGTDHLEDITLTMDAPLHPISFRQFGNLRNLTVGCEVMRYEPPLASLLPVTLNHLTIWYYESSTIRLRNQDGRRSWCSEAGVFDDGWWLYSRESVNWLENFAKEC
ncbi:hypothetical protein GGR51DRAFT_571203 [Nemania sp. FL0031]|nr:hypothetical protein GGR51DRAFT_571203 [Nemania sp. FL0031]